MKKKLTFETDLILDHDLIFSKLLSTIKGGWVNTKLSKKKLPRLFTASKTGYLDRKRLFQ